MWLRVVYAQVRMLVTSDQLLNAIDRLIVVIIITKIADLVGSKTVFVCSSSQDRSYEKNPQQGQK